MIVYKDLVEGQAHNLKLGTQAQEIIWALNMMMYDYDLSMEATTIYDENIFTCTRPI